MPLNIVISSELFPEKENSQEVLLRQPITAEQLISEIMREFRLDDQRYILRHPRSDRVLAPLTTLEEQGVRENDVLIFTKGTTASLQTSSGELIPITSSVTVVGRPKLNTASNPIRVDLDLTRFDPTNSTSRPHARILNENEHFFLESLKADNLTYVNNKPVPMQHKHRILHGDVIRFGSKVQMTFLIAEVQKAIATTDHSRGLNETQETPTLS